MRDSRTPADQDLALLARPELRAVRLLLEYMKPELAFRDLSVRHTVVVFGSARLPEDNPYYQIGRELGGIIGRMGDGPPDNRIVVMTGGGPGGMEAANRGAHDVGAASIGLNIRLPYEQGANPYLTPGLDFEFRYFALRKMHFMLRARALVALPGGFGTLDELFETLCLIQTRKRPPLPVVLVGQSFWRRVVDFDFLVSEGMIDPADLELFCYAETAAEVWQSIVDWYETRGSSVYDGEPVLG